MSKWTVPTWLKWMLGMGGDPQKITPLGTGGEQPAKPDASGVIQPKQSSVLDWLDGMLGRKKVAPQGDPATGQRLMGYFESQGWTHAQSAGIVANLERESSFSPTAQGDKDKNTGEYQAYGLGQWHSDRQKKFAEWSGHDIKGSSLDEQMQFVQYELTHNEKAAGDILKTAPNASTAAYVVNSQYERTRDVAGENTIRGQGAERYAAMPATSGPAATADSKHEVIIKVQAAPGTQATTTTTGTGPGTVQIYRAMP
jgi:hypothetical protein